MTRRPHNRKAPQPECRKAGRTWTFGSGDWCSRGRSWHTCSTLLATATLLGIGVSSVAGWLADNYGRKRALAVFALFTVLIAVVPNFTVFLVLRFLAGLGLGGVWGAVSTYAVESWPAASRGRAAAFILSSFPVGGMVAAVLSGLFLPAGRTR
ncbi:MAG TPA: MFS transporter [Pseudonocardia sp.]|nr:MFS transporter [Pseudonocardia sp.]